MRQLLICLLTLCLSLPAFAERKQTFANIDVHYSVFNSSFLQPNTATASGLVRSKKLGVITVSVLRDGKPLTAKVSGSLKNLLGQLSMLTFKQIDEQGASYYVAQFALEGREMLTFNLDISTRDGGSNTLTFNQEVFPDE